MNITRASIAIAMVAFLSSSHVAQGAINVTIQNFSGTFAGNPIVDNAGVPLSIDETTLEIGTFEASFAANFPGLNLQCDVETVIDGFIPGASSSVDLVIPGLFNYTQEVDLDVGSPVYMMITHLGGLKTVLVFDLGRVFPPQDGPGNPDIDLGRILEPSDLVFGNPTHAHVDTSTLPVPFQNPEFEQGMMIGVLTPGFDECIPEPNTSLMLLAAMMILGNRRRKSC